MHTMPAPWQSPSHPKALAWRLLCSYIATKELHSSLLVDPPTHSLNLLNDRTSNRPTAERPKFFKVEKSFKHLDIDLDKSTPLTVRKSIFKGGGEYQSAGAPQGDGGGVAQGFQTEAPHKD